MLNFNMQQKLKLEQVEHIKAKKKYEEEHGSGYVFKQRFKTLGGLDGKEVTKVSVDLNTEMREQQSGLHQLAHRARQVTPNPFYHQQKRKLLLKYQKQLLEKQMQEEYFNRGQRRESESPTK